MDDQGPLGRLISALTATPTRIAMTLGGAALLFGAAVPVVFMDWSPKGKIPMDWSKDEQRPVDLPAGTFARRGGSAQNSLDMLRGGGAFAQKGSASATSAPPGAPPPPGAASSTGEPPPPDGEPPSDVPRPGLQTTSGLSGGRGGRGGGGYGGAGGGPYRDIGGTTKGLGPDSAPGAAKTSDAWKGTDEHYMVGGGKKGSGGAPGGAGGTSSTNALEGEAGDMAEIGAGADGGGGAGAGKGSTPKTTPFGGFGGGGGGGGGTGSSGGAGGDTADHSGDSPACQDARTKYGTLLAGYEADAIKYERQFAQNCGGGYSRSTCGNPWLSYCRYTTGIWAAIYQKYCSCARIRCNADSAKRGLDDVRKRIAAACPGGG